MTYYTPVTKAMDHSDMDHGAPAADRCSMDMLFTWNWQNTCVVFKWWHIRSFTDFVLSFVAIVLLTAGYEWIKTLVESWERVHSATLTGANTNATAAAIRQYKLKRSFFYGVQVGYSFLLMLVFMTYNGWLMIAVAVGAALGNYLWGSVSREGAARALACH